MVLFRAGRAVVAIGARALAVDAGHQMRAVASRDLLARRTGSRRRRPRRIVDREGVRHGKADPQNGRPRLADVIHHPVHIPPLVARPIEVAAPVVGADDAVRIAVETVEEQRRVAAVGRDEGIRRTGVVERGAVQPAGVVAVVPVPPDHDAAPQLAREMIDDPVVRKHVSQVRNREVALAVRVAQVHRPIPVIVEPVVEEDVVARIELGPQGQVPGHVHRLAPHHGRDPADEAVGQHVVPDVIVADDASTVGVHLVHAGIIHPRRAGVVRRAQHSVRAGLVDPVMRDVVEADVDLLQVRARATGQVQPEDRERRAIGQHPGIPRHHARIRHLHDGVGAAVGIVGHHRVHTLDAVAHAVAELVEHASGATSDDIVENEAGHAPPELRPHRHKERVQVPGTIQARADRAIVGTRDSRTNRVTHMLARLHNDPRVITQVRRLIVIRRHGDRAGKREHGHAHPGQRLLIVGVCQLQRDRLVQAGVPQVGIRLVIAVRDDDYPGGHFPPRARQGRDIAHAEHADVYRRRQRVRREVHLDARQSKRLDGLTDHIESERGERRAARQHRVILVRHGGDLHGHPREEHCLHPVRIGQFTHRR